MKTGKGDNRRPLRWTINFASTEFLVRRDSLSMALKAAGEKAGDDGKFSTFQIVRALFVHEALALEAKAARHRSQIDEAEMTRLEREALESRFIECDDVRTLLCPGVAKATAVVVKSKMTASDKRAVHREIAELKARFAEMGMPARSQN